MGKIRLMYYAGIITLEEAIELVKKYKEKQNVSISKTNR